MVKSSGTQQELLKAIQDEARHKRFKNMFGGNEFTGEKDLTNKTGCKDSHTKRNMDFKDSKSFKDTAEFDGFQDKVRHKHSKNMLVDKEFEGKTEKKDSTNNSRCKKKGPKNKAPRKDFTCDVCNKSYKLKIAFMSHQMSHVASTLVCEVCHKQFTSNKLLKLHFRTHSDVRFFFCELCNKGFKHKHHLRAHFITHTDEFPFVCEVCNKGYKHKWTLKLHEVMHAKEPTFVCEVCGKAFEQGCDLDKHCSIHLKKSLKVEDSDREIKLLTVKDEPSQGITIETCQENVPE